MPRRTIEGDATRSTNRAVDRAMLLLELLSSDDEGCRLLDLADRADLSSSTVHRILTTMEERRFVQFDRSDGLWHIGRQSYAVGATFIRRRNFVGTALPFLKQLRDLTRETVNLAVADGGEVVILAQVESREIVRAITRPGGRALMTSSSLGKAILAHYSDEDVVALVKTHGLVRVTPNSIVQASALLAELEATRAQGFAVDNEESTPGLRCVASAIFSPLGEPLCAVSISGPSLRVSKDRLVTLGETVRDTAVKVTEAIAGMPS